jgi:hypothetical protein
VSERLDTVQRWFQDVITDPRGSESRPASEIEAVITRSRRLSASGRLQVYADAYYARLIECLTDTFPATARALGQETFQSFAFEYLQAYPSQSYTLSILGGQFPRFLEQTRPALEPDEELPSWPELLVDLTRLELTIDAVFDGPGSERAERFDWSQVASWSPDQFLAARVEFSPAARLLAFRFDVNTYYQQLRHSEPEAVIDPPSAAPHWLALTRRDYVVRRIPLSTVQFQLAQELQNGIPIGAAIDRSAGTVSDDELMLTLRDAFGAWSGAWLVTRLTI